MTYRVRPVAARVPGVLAALAITAFYGAADVSAQRAAEAPIPANVDAVYRISFTALGNIGHFHFNSQVAGEGYNLTADAKIDTTIFDYKGDMKSRGAVTSAGVRTQPADYTFNYRQKTFLKKKKIRSLNIAFRGPAVASVTPADAPSDKAVPVMAEHLRNVLDPLSGVMALSLTNPSRPCDQKLPIYDGKQRFDIVFKPLRRAGADHVCDVRLVPISGHKPGEGSTSVIKGKIELVMRPVPKANIVIPYSVTVPTIVGTATLTSENIDITMPDRQRIALRR